MRRLVLTLKESRPPATADLAQVESSAVHVLDRIGRILKVEALDQAVADLATKLPSWHVQPDAEYSVPDTRRLIEPTSRDAGDS